MQTRDQIKNQKAELSVGAAESFSIGTIFVHFLKDSWHVFLEETAKYLLFPAAAMLALLKALFSWRQASLENYKKSSSVLRAIAETLTAGVITFAVIASLAGAVLFGAAAPVIFAFTLGVKSLFHLCCSAWYGLKMAFASDPAEKEAYKAAAYTNLVATFAGMLSTAAVTAAMIFAKPIVAILGIVSAVGSIIYAGYKFFTTSEPEASSAGYVPMSDAPAQATDKPDASPGPGPAPSPSPSVQAALTAANSNAPVPAAVAPTATPAAVAPASDTPVIPKSVEPLATGDKLGSLLVKRGFYAQPITLPAIRVEMEHSRVAAPAA